MTASPESQPSSPAARYVMIGGFLGAGKTTAVARFAALLQARGLRAGLITNDQGSGLVDTSVLRARGFATEEIPGGCFCCRFNSLVDAAGRLTAATRPDVFVAEPVGSCTDLVATVTYPLRRIYGDSFTIAPLSVLIDPQRALRVFGLAEGRAFSDKVLYIYRKQLEEADIIVINKQDTVTAAELCALRGVLQRDYPHAEVLAVSARTGEGLDAWFDRLLASEQQARRVMEVDYAIYADGEALLGWLNATLQLTASAEFDANTVLEALARTLQQQLAGAGAEVAHLKMTFSPDGGLNDLASLNLVRSDFVPELSLRLDQDCTAGQLILNLRAEAAPAALKTALEAALAALRATFPSVTFSLDHLEHFRPGKPQPTHRLLTPA
ncbi:GTP-binding protein [Horticoccus sp. 23ND18S-11]|uniref:GTP-binding protein n=1 Tax=Horticoccus sp. 23ND18S-11 TaxID=3391832 RepID=UPI0039C96696